MRRLNVSEIHEQPWFPKKLRDDVTDTLQFIFNFRRIYRPIAGNLAAAIHAAGSDRVVDLCSGAGGPWRWLGSELARHNGRRLQVVLTDKYPNLAAFDRVQRDFDGAIGYCAEPVDAQNIPVSLAGFRTIFSSIHHFSPGAVASILRDAADRGEGIGFFEIAKRRPATIASASAMPAAALCLVPFMRPFRVARLVWTYLLPIIPFVLFFDGVASCLRAYSPAELRALSSRACAANYTWEVGQAGRITYLLGYPGSQPR